MNLNKYTIICSKNSIMGFYLFIIKFDDKLIEKNALFIFDQFLPAIILNSKSSAILNSIRLVSTQPNSAHPLEFYQICS